MRFLCLHGWGINSEIFEIQTAALRYHMGGDHTYEFVDGSFLCPALPGIEAIYGPQDECYAYFDPLSLSSICKATEDLKNYIAADGPFDGVIGYSQGAALAATLLVQDRAARPSHPTSLFKCAIFLSGGVPFDPVAMGRSELRELDPAVDGEPITIPTANIWGLNDFDFPNTSPKLCKLCKAECRTEVIHQGGHEIPTLKGENLTNIVRAVQETIAAALSV